MGTMKARVEVRRDTHAMYDTVHRALIDRYRYTHTVKAHRLDFFGFALITGGPLDQKVLLTVRSFYWAFKQQVGEAIIY
jgi:hypothetical protein